MEAKRRRRVTIGLGLGIAVLSLLLVSAGGERREARGGRPDPALAQRAAWTRMLLGMTAELPREDRAAWRELARRDPQFLMQASVGLVAAADPGLVPAPGAEVVSP